MIFCYRQTDRQIIIYISSYFIHHPHCLLLQPHTNDGRTPLMDAAVAAQDEMVKLLLSMGASPDKTANDNLTALIFAIQSKCLTTINLLAPVTQVSLGRALFFLASENIEVMTGELRQLVERAAQDREAAIEGLEGAAKFGSSLMIEMIAQYTKDHSIFEAKKVDIWMEAVKSDSKATVSALLPLLPNPPLEAITLARERGVPGVVRLLLPDTKVEGEEEREALRDAVLANTAELLDQMPRDVEFTYNDKMDKLKPLLSSSITNSNRIKEMLMTIKKMFISKRNSKASSTMVPYTTLLENLHLPKAHYEEATCPMVCGQKQNCHRIRETMSLVDLIVAELGKRFKVFEGMDIAMIGSTREGSRAFFYDEVDVHLSLNKDFKKFSYFDAKQMVLKRDPSRAENPEDCDKYFDENNFLKPDLYFHDFVASVHSIISTLELPEDFTMLPLTTSFTPCTRCMTTKHKGLQVMRCRHKADCEQHKRCRCEEPSKCKCLDECGCREYASPSLTWSKVGVVLHLQWREEDGTIVTIDVDLNCPTWPTHTRFNGSINDYANYLMRERPVGWLEEFSKLENMASAASSAHLLTSNIIWPVKFRLINRDTVLPSQVTNLTLL